MDFRVSSYIESLDDHQRDIATRLRGIIYREVPEVVEKFSFKIPFYHYHGMFCYINAVAGGVELAFCRGKDLVFAYPQLSLEKRVMVAGVKIYSPRDIEKLEISHLIAGAAHWQVEAKMEKRRFIRKNR